MHVRMKYECVGKVHLKWCVVCSVEVITSIMINWNCCALEIYSVPHNILTDVSSVFFAAQNLHLILH